MVKNDKVMESEFKELIESGKIAEEDWEKFADPYFLSFNGQIFEQEKYEFDAYFNFANHDLQKFGVFNNIQRSNCFDFEKELIVILTSANRDTEVSNKIHVFSENSQGWVSAKLEPENWLYQVFRYKGLLYLLGVTDREPYNYAKGIVYDLEDNYRARMLVTYCVDIGTFKSNPKKKVTCDFYSKDRNDAEKELLTVQMERVKRRHHHVKVVNSLGEVLAEINCSDS